MFYPHKNFFSFIPRFSFFLLFYLFTFLFHFHHIFYTYILPPFQQNNQLMIPAFEVQVMFHNLPWEIMKYNFPASLQYPCRLWCQTKHQSCGAGNGISFPARVEDSPHVAPCTLGWDHRLNTVKSMAGTQVAT